jgi:adenylate cyclase
MSPDTNKIKPGDEVSRTGHGIPLNLVVLTADLVGYSELVFRDVQNSISVLRQTRGIVAESITRHSGKVLQTPGDFILATFDEFGRALNAAVAAQARLLTHHRSESQKKGGHWKIGIAAGEVYVIEEDYFGNAINVAARLQSLAGPGDILYTFASGSHGNVEGATIQDLGRKKLKNIDDPVQVYRAYLPAYELFMETSRADLKMSPRLLKHLRKPTLRLEPFRSLNHSEKSHLFADALVGEVQLILSRLSNSILVVDPTASIAGNHDYVLSGTIQSGGPYLRIMARLASTSDGLTMWAERYECDLESSFDVQDQISREIVAALQLALTEGEQAQLVRRGTKSGKAWDLFQRAHDIERQFTREGHEKAKDFYEQALALDPEYLSALVALAFCHLDEVRLGWSKDERDSLERANTLCDRATGSATRNADVLALKAFLGFFQKRWDEARAKMQEAVQVAPQSPEIIGYQGALFDLMGDFRAAIGSYTRALSLSAHSPAWIPSNMGLSQLALGNNEEAEHIYREVLEHHPKYVRAWIGLAVALNRQGKNDEALRAADRVLLLDPSFSAAEWVKSRPFNDDRLLDAFTADLRSVGLQ